MTPYYGTVGVDRLPRIAAAYVYVRDSQSPFVITRRRGSRGCVHRIAMEMLVACTDGCHFRGGHSQLGK